VSISLITIDLITDSVIGSYSSHVLWLWFARSDEGSGSLRWVFSLRELRSPTNSFNYDNKIGEGPLGRVYWGQVWDGSQVSALYIFILAANRRFTLSRLSFFLAQLFSHHYFAPPGNFYWHLFSPNN
jgi:hypothetical protein